MPTKWNHLRSLARQKHGPPHQAKHNLRIGDLLHLLCFVIRWVKVQLGESRPQFFDEGFSHIICQYDLHAAILSEGVVFNSAQIFL